jgi:hypothetical protein
MPCSPYMNRCLEDDTFLLNVGSQYTAIYPNNIRNYCCKKLKPFSVTVLYWRDQVNTEKNYLSIWSLLHWVAWASPLEFNAVYLCLFASVLPEFDDWGFIVYIPSSTTRSSSCGVRIQWTAWRCEGEAPSKWLLGETSFGVIKLKTTRSVPGIEPATTKIGNKLHNNSFHFGILNTLRFLGKCIGGKTCLFFSTNSV